MSQCLSVCLSVSKRRCANLTDVTLADQATNSIQADNANMAIQGNVALKVTQLSTCWTTFEPMQETSSNDKF